jgi:hypothetical protein
LYLHPLVVLPVLVLLVGQLIASSNSDYIRYWRNWYLHPLVILSVLVLLVGQLLHPPLTFAKIFLGISKPANILFIYTWISIALSQIWKMVLTT